MNGSLVGLLDDSHATGCGGQEYSTVEVAPWGRGFAVVRAEWCGECGAADYELLDTLQPEGSA